MRAQAILAAAAAAALIAAVGVARRPGTAIERPPASAPMVSAQRRAPTAEEEAGWDPTFWSPPADAGTVTRSAPPESAPPPSRPPRPAARPAPKTADASAARRPGPAPQPVAISTMQPPDSQVAPDGAGASGPGKPVRRGRLDGGDASGDLPETLSDPRQITAGGEQPSAVIPQQAAPVLTPPVLVDPGRLDYPASGYRIVVERAGLTVQDRVQAARGRVVLKVLVRADGTVAAVEVARPSGDPALDAAAATSAWTWLFQPATRDNQPIDSWALVPVVFLPE